MLRKLQGWRNESVLRVMSYPGSSPAALRLRRKDPRPSMNKAQREAVFRLIGCFGGLAPLLSSLSQGEREYTCTLPSAPHLHLHLPATSWPAWLQLLPLGFPASPPDLANLLSTQQPEESVLTRCSSDRATEDPVQMLHHGPGGSAPSAPCPSSLIRVSLPFTHHIPDMWPFFQFLQHSSAPPFCLHLQVFPHSLSSCSFSAFGAQFEVTS